MEASTRPGELCTSIRSIMKKILHFAALLLLLAGCNGHRGTVIPHTSDLRTDSALTILWHGTSTAYRYVGDQYVPDPHYDYLFTVVQRRHANEWRSYKDLHRLHPDYDGRAGDRDQTMYFHVAYMPGGGGLRTRITSSLGDGEGHSDAEYREQRFTIALKDAGAFSPFDHIRITQHYAYEEGVLRETVELFKLKDGQEVPFMRNEEMAWFHVRGTLPGAPGVDRL